MLNRIEITTKFKEMQTKEDLVGLLNFVRPEVFPDSPFIFSIKQLNKYTAYLAINVNTYQQTEGKSILEWLNRISKKSYGIRYKTFQIRKKSGKTRTIHAPKPGLKAILKCLNVILQAIHTPHKSATGFVPGKSIVDNARIHEDQNYVYNLDLKDFFPSVDQARVRGRLMVPPFNLGENEGRKKLASIIAILCCNSMEVERWNEGGNVWEKQVLNVLPQGAPTSPTITNFICEHMDIKLSGLAKRFNCKYSRYADDITFSSMHNVYQKNGAFVTSLHEIIKAQNFHIQESKTRLQKRGYRQEVTGLIVNDKVNVDQRYVKQIRHWIYFWEKYGYEKAMGLFLIKYRSDKGHVKSGKSNFENVLWGKLEYLKMVKGAKNSTYLALYKRYTTLISQPIAEVLDMWEKEGIEKAMNLYYGSSSKDSKIKSNQTFASIIETLKIKGENINELRVIKNRLSLLSDKGTEIKTFFIGKKYLGENINDLKIDKPDELKKWMVLENGVGGKDWLFYQIFDAADFEIL